MINEESDGKFVALNFGNICGPNNKNDGNTLSTLITSHRAN